MKYLKIISAVLLCSILMPNYIIANAESESILIEAEAYESTTAETVTHCNNENGHFCQFQSQLEFEVRYVIYAPYQGNYVLDMVCTTLDDTTCFSVETNGIEYIVNQFETALINNMGNEYGHYSLNVPMFLKRGFNIVKIEADAGNVLCVDYMRFTKTDNSHTKEIGLEKDICTDDIFEYEIRCNRSGYYDIYFTMNAEVFEQDSYAPVYFSCGSVQELRLHGGTVNNLWQDATVTEINSQSKTECGKYKLKEPVYIEAGVNKIYFITNASDLSLKIDCVEYKFNQGNLSGANICLRRSVLKPRAVTAISLEAYNEFGDLMDIDELRQNGMVTFAVADTYIAKVNAIGEVTAGNIGSTTITVNIFDGKSLITKSVPLTVSETGNGLIVPDAEVIEDKVYANISNLREFDDADNGTAVLAQYKNGILMRCDIIEIDEVAAGNVKIFSAPAVIKDKGEILVTVWDNIENLIPIARQYIKKEVGQK